MDGAPSRSLLAAIRQANENIISLGLSRCDATLGLTLPCQADRRPPELRNSLNGDRR